MDLLEIDGRLEDYDLHDEEITREIRSVQSAEESVKRIKSVWKDELVPNLRKNSEYLRMTIIPSTKNPGLTGIEELLTLEVETTETSGSKNEFRKVTWENGLVEYLILSSRFGAIEINTEQPLKINGILDILHWKNVSQMYDEDPVLRTTLYYEVLGKPMMTSRE